MGLSLEQVREGVRGKLVSAEIAALENGNRFAASILRPMVEVARNRAMKDATRWFERQLGKSEKAEQEYMSLALSAKHVNIMIGCCDARVGAPFQLINGELFVYIPYIGGGDPGKEALSSLIKELQSWGVSIYDISVIMTQHGTTEEIEDPHAEQCDCIECGLRVFRKTYQNELDEIARTRGTYQEQLAIELSQRLGNAISPNLILIAAERNFSGHIMTNLQEVFWQVRKHVSGVEFLGGLFDHKRREISVIAYDQVEGFKETDRVKLPGEHKIQGQDPSGILVKVGPKSTAMHAAVYLPELVGRIGIQNDFTASATTATIQSIADAISQASYAAGNHKSAREGHVHGNSFKKLQYLVFACDGDQESRRVREVLSSPWFSLYYKEKFAPLGYAFILNTSDKNVQSVSLAA